MPVNKPSSQLALAIIVCAVAGCPRKPEAQPGFPPARWANALGMEFVRVPAGEFLMGTSEAEIKALIARFGEVRSKVAAEKPRHRVRITRSFLMGRFEVTVGQFGRFVEAAGYKTDAERGGGSKVFGADDTWEKKPKANWQNRGFKQTKAHPVVCVSWNDAREFIQWLNGADTRKPKGWTYRLPTEAEWEYAARGAQRREYAWGGKWDGTRGNFADKRSGVMWADQTADDGHARTAPVGSYSPKGDSPFGVSDMTGNAWEWCQDWFDEGFYQRSPVDDPVNTKKGKKRVERGGSWAFTEDYCRAAFRFSLEPGESYDNLGFRLALAPARPKGD